VTCYTLFLLADTLDVQGPTVFPIVFSAIMGWCLKTYGRYKSERGVELGVSTIHSPK
jgi:hypothetical protein